MFNLDNLLMIMASLVLLFVDWLAFHDIGEPHTVRDWLMLGGTVLVFIQFARVFWSRNFAHR